MKFYFKRKTDVFNARISLNLLNIVSVNLAFIKQKIIPMGVLSEKTENNLIEFKIIYDCIRKLYKPTELVMYIKLTE